MRSDYGLYVVAVICFVLAAIFATSMVPGYAISTASGITVTVVFSLIGIIAAAVGYSARPKAMMPPTEPAPAPVASAPIVEPTTMTEELAEPSMPPVPAPVEEISVSVAHAPTPEPSEPSPPIVEMHTEPEAPPAPPMETSASADVAAKEKPKPARRRRKKATA